MYEAGLSGFEQSTKLMKQHHKASSFPVPLQMEATLLTSLTTHSAVLSVLRVSLPFGIVQHGVGGVMLAYQDTTNIS